MGEGDGEDISSSLYVTTWCFLPISVREDNHFGIIRCYFGITLDDQIDRLSVAYLHYMNINDPFEIQLSVVALGRILTQ